MRENKVDDEDAQEFEGVDVTSILDILKQIQANPLANAAEGQLIKDLVTKLVKGLRFSSKDSDNKSIDRLIETLNSFSLAQSELIREAKWNSAAASREATEPSFEYFVKDAIDASIQSRNLPTREVIGQLIARRLQINDTDDESVRLSEALRISKDASRAELRIIAAVELVRRFTAYKKPKTLSTVDAEKWIAESFGKKILGQGHSPFQRLDCEHLVYIGALPGPIVSVPFDPAHRGDPIVAYLRDNEIGHEITSKGSLWLDDRELLATFPVMLALMEISRGVPDGPGNWLRIDSLRLTRPGQIVASLVYKLI